MTRREKIREGLDCLGFLLFMALILLVSAYSSKQPGMHSEAMFRESHHGY